MLYILLADRAVDHSRLTETTAADAAAHDLENHAVLGRLDKRNQRFLRVDGLCHFHNKLLFYLLRHPRAVGRKLLIVPSSSYVTSYKDGT